MNALLTLESAAPPLVVAPSASPPSPPSHHDSALIDAEKDIVWPDMRADAMSDVGFGERHNGGSTWASGGSAYGQQITPATLPSAEVGALKGGGVGVSSTRQWQSRFMALAKERGGRVDAATAGAGSWSVLHAIITGAERYARTPALCVYNI